jgi:hypothetical protein
MFKNNTAQDHHTICNYVPGFAFYEGIGGRLAEAVVDFVEAIIDLIGKYRT